MHSVARVDEGQFETCKFKGAAQFFHKAQEASAFSYHTNGVNVGHVLYFVDSALPLVTPPARVRTNMPNAQPWVTTARLRTSRRP